MTINMKNQPRATGKTTTLIMQALTDRINYGATARQVFISGHGPREALYRHYFNKLRLRDLNSHSSLDDIRGIIDNKIFVYIDEPFIMDAKQQACLLEDLSIYAKSNSITVLGIGTATEVCSRKLFKDYLCN